MTVSHGSSLDAKELVRQAVDIVDLVGSSVQLRRQGRNFVGLCPWHDDSRPSLQVNPERQSFKCWVCDIGGDIFSFVMKTEGVTFPEALKMLADRAGIPLEPTRSREPGEAGGPHDKQTLYHAMAWAEKQYHECLMGWPEAEPARRYLQERGITPQSIEKYHLGFSPNRPAWILERSEGSGFGSKVLEAAGILARPAAGGSLYDRFRGRLLFSIRDTQARPVGFGGRVLPETGTTSRAKYINSPETPLFSKSALLYGLDVARDAMRKGGTALVMEGYTDCIVAHQHGFQDAVAVLGTALGQQHVRTLRRFADRIVLVLDADEAGQRRANEVLELFVAENVDLRILTLPEGMDPCEFLQEHGAEAFGDMLANRAIDALEHAFEATTRGLDLAGDVHGASQALERLVSIVAKAPRLRADTSAEVRFRQEKILQRLAASFRVPEQVVRGRLTALRRAAQRRAGQASQGPARSGPAEREAAVPPQAVEVIEPWERELLEMVIQFPGRLAEIRAEIPLEQMASQPGRRMYEACLRLSEEGTGPTFERLMLEFDDPAVKSFLVELDEYGRAKEVQDPVMLLRKLVSSIRCAAVERQRPAQRAALREKRLDENQKTELFQEIIQQERIVQQEKTRQGYSEPTDG